MIFDKTGRRIKPGMLVDIQTSGMMTCMVTEVSESEITMPDGRTAEPRVIVQPMPCALNIGKNRIGNLIAPDVYIVKSDVPEQPGKPDISLVS